MQIYKHVAIKYETNDAHPTVIGNNWSHELHPHHTITVNSHFLCQLRTSVNGWRNLSSCISNRTHNKKYINVSGLNRPVLEKYSSYIAIVL